MVKKKLLTVFLLAVSTQIECKRIKNVRISKSGSFEHTKLERDLKSKWPEICKKYKNSVVQIYSYVNIFNLKDPSKTGSMQYKKVGTGFFISEDGHLLTNFHVVCDAPVVEIRIPTLGGQSFDVEMVGCFPQKDFALLKVKEESLEELKKLLNITKITALEFGDSDKLIESQNVICLGYPLGQKNLKIGIGNISGFESLDNIGECTQTTAPINPGNSGGPFLDEDGKVVGIATLKAEGAEGIGYFIPISFVKASLEALYSKSIIGSVYFGLTLQSTTEETLSFLGNPTDGGVYVNEVEKKSLAEKAKIKVGDIVYEIDGLKLDRYGYIMPPWRSTRIYFTDYISQLKIGSTVTLVIYRDGEKISLQIQLESGDDFEIKQFYPWLQDSPDYERIGGIVVSQLTLNHISHILHTEGYFKGALKYMQSKYCFEPRVLISCIYPGSIALAYKFRPDDVIISKVNDIEVKTVQDIREAILTGCGDNHDYLTIETEGGFFAAIPVKKLIEEEQLVAKINGLKESEFIKQMADKYQL